VRLALRRAPLRASGVHLTSNWLPARFTLYFASAFVLVVLWATLLVRLLRAG
jgi:hypothetical protein